MKYSLVLSIGAALSVAGGIVALLRPDPQLVWQQHEFVSVFGPYAPTGSLILRPLDSGITYEVPYPFSQGAAGDSLDFPDFSVMLCGRDDALNLGMLLRYGRNAQAQMVLLDQHGWPQADITGVAYRSMVGSGELYVLDDVSGTIYSSVYVAGQPVPTTWTAFATPGTVPFLGTAAADDCRLFVADGIDKLLVAKRWETVNAEHVWIDLSSGAGLQADGTAGWPRLVDGPLQEVRVDATSVVVEGPPGSQVEVVAVFPDDSWAAIGAGTIDAFGSALVGVPALDFGLKIAAKRSDLTHPTPPFKAITDRTGVPDFFDVGSVIRPLDATIAGSGAVVGRDTFGFPLWIDHVQPASVVVPSSFSAVCAVGVPSQIIAIDQAMGRYLLNTVGQIPATIEIWSSSEPGFGGADLTIPGDPGLAGQVYCYQWWINTGSTIALSDIVHFSVRAEYPGQPNYMEMLNPCSVPAPIVARAIGNAPLRRPISRNDNLTESESRAAVRRLLARTRCTPPSEARLRLATVRASAGLPN